MSYDRTGEVINADEQDEPQERPHDPGCNGKGWINHDPDHPRPCLRCKPHLAPDKLRRAMGLGEKK